MARKSSRKQASQNKTPSPSDDGSEPSLVGRINPAISPTTKQRATKKKASYAPKITQQEYHDRLESELLDAIEEEMEHDLEELFEEEFARKSGMKSEGDLEARASFRREYFKELRRLQIELVKLQDWVVATGYKLVVIFEGRDSAGKGGVIKRLTQRTNPRVCRVVALPAPTDREKTQWYFQRYVQHLPAAGEVIFFDRSWYNRPGVERVMGFSNEAQVQQYFKEVPLFEEMLVGSGIKLLKYWFSITDEEQEFRFQCRITDPLKQWKLSPMDLQSRIRWEDYTKAKEDILARTNFEYAPWFVVPANDKKRARLNCMNHLLSQVPYKRVTHEEVVLPRRRRNQGYRRNPVPESMIVPQLY